MGNWESSKEVDKTTGEIKYIYTCDGSTCKRVVLKSHLAKQLSGYILIEKDLRNVETWLGEIEKLNNAKMPESGTSYLLSTDRDRFNHVKGLFVAALTFYGKCFSRCEGRRIKLDRAQIKKTYYEVHDECMSYRHNFAAHSGAAKLEQANAILAIHDGDNFETSIFRELEQPDLLWRGVGEGSFIALVQHVHSIVEEKMDDLANKIMKEEIIPKGHQYWQNLDV